MIEFKNHVMDIRKLTPKECWRLMGWGYRDVKHSWHDDAFYKAAAVNSNTQLYKQAGNGIVTNCIEVIGEKLVEHGIDELHLTELFGGIGCQRIASTVTARYHKGIDADCDNLVIVCVAQYGRNPDNPTSRKVGLPTEQRYEVCKEKKHSSFNHDSR